MFQIMARNEQGSNLQAASMQSQPRTSAHGSHHTGGRLKSKCSRMSRVEDKSSLKQVSRTINHASGSGSKFTSSKLLQTSVKLETSTQAVSLSEEKFNHVPSFPGYKNDTNCFSGSSDSESDADIEIDLNALASNIALNGHRSQSIQMDTPSPASIQSSPLSIDLNIKSGNSGSTAGNLRNPVGEDQNQNDLYWGTASSMSNQSHFSINSSVRIMNPKNSHERFGNQLRGKMKCDDQCGFFDSHAERTQEEGSSVSLYGSSMSEEELAGSSFKAQEFSLTGRSWCSCQSGLAASRSIHDGSLEAICMCKVGNIRCEDSNTLHRKFTRNKASKHFREPGISRQDFVCKRKNYDQGALGPRQIGSVSSGLGFRGSSVAGPSTDSRRHDSGSLGCSSSDVLQSSFINNPNLSHCLKAFGSNNINNKRGIVKGQKSGKSSVSALAVGCLPYRNSRDESVGLPSERNSSKANSHSIQSVRRSCPSFSSEVWCSRSLSSAEQKSGVSSGSSKGISHQSTFPSRGSRTTSPSVSRSKTINRPSLRLGVDGFATDIAHNNMPVHRYSASSSRDTSAGNCSVNQFGTMGVETGYSLRSNTDDSGNSTSSMRGFIRDNEEMPSSSTAFRPPPSRPPLYFPALAPNQKHSGYYPSSSSSSYLSDSRFQHFSTSNDRNNLPNAALGPRFRRPVPSSEVTFATHHASSMGSLLCRRSYQEAQIETARGNQPRMMMEGLSEILAALEDAERDEALSYEQILMLEATILLGGMGLHDRYRDMRLDVDNMSYEELLALEEQMGNVSTGLNEDDVAKCVNRSRYTSLNLSINYVPQEVEIKCSICQEEFVEDIDLGILNCGHSYHIPCIKQWLLQKNQCPICKAPAVS